MASASNIDDIVDAPVISFADGSIFVDGQFVGPIPSSRQRLGDLEIALRHRRAIAEVTEPGKSNRGKVQVELDQRMEGRVVKDVVAAASAAGYAQVGFIVHRAE